LVLAASLTASCRGAEADAAQPGAGAGGQGATGGAGGAAAGGGGGTATGGAAGACAAPAPANNRDYAPYAIEAIDAASERVHVIEYVIYNSGTVTDLLDAMVAAADRGVEVKLLADEEADDIDDVLAFLEDGGVTAKKDSPEKTTHNKLIIADDISLVGSHNFSTSAMEYNNEASVRICDPRVADYYEGYFQALWQSPTVTPVLSKPNSPPVTPLHNSEIVEHLEACLTEASSRVRVVLYAACYRHDYPGSDANRMVEGLVEAHQAGLDVKVILDQSDWMVEQHINDAAIDMLVAGGVELRFPAPGRVTHAKMLLCDDTVIVSDANWCYSGFTLYNGTSAQIDSADFAGQYIEYFDSIWQHSTPAPPQASGR